MTSDQDYNSFNPSGVGMRNGNFIGLPFTRETAGVIFLPVPWDLTTSYRPGTSGGPANILRESVQLDLYDSFVPDGWKGGIHFLPVNQDWEKRNIMHRPDAERYIAFLEGGGKVEENKQMEMLRNELNRQCFELHDEVRQACTEIINSGKIAAVIGGEHSVAWGLLRALSEKYNDFGILQLDAHMDLRNSYEGLDYSHASVMNNALRLNQVSRLVQVGVRDFCIEEVEKVNSEGKRIAVFSDKRISEMSFRGDNFSTIAGTIIDQLPEHVYLSFDIDGLDPSLCPGTGTPVPGGIAYREAVFLLRELVKSGRKIIGFDLSETAGDGPWDGNVGARIVYQLAILSMKSWGLV